MMNTTCFKKTMPIHRVRDVENYKTRNHINSISWPAQSTDLNINENVWLKMKRRLQSRAKTSGLQLNFQCDHIGVVIFDCRLHTEPVQVTAETHETKVIRGKGEMTIY